ncbi:gem associated protein 2, partial [Tremellales sp. Uapishka_1]
MARKGQAAAKRKREEEEGDPESFPKLQALPVATLPEDFDGEPEDGAQYLALANRSNKTLPFFTRVANPYREPSPPLLTSLASSTRHPGLPRDSWQILQALHFDGYRNLIQESFPPSLALAYPTDYPPLPEASQRQEWFYFINGYPRRRIKRKAVLVVVDMAEEDEEAMMNGAPGPSVPIQSPPKVEDEAFETQDGHGDEDDDDDESNAEENDEEEVADDDDFELENETGRHRPREPLVSVLQNLNSNQSVKILSHFSYWLRAAVSSMTPSNFLPTQPQHAFLRADSPTQHTEPFPTHYARWIFALLCTLSPQLTGGQTSVLRELARSAMQVVRWRLSREHNHFEREWWTRTKGAAGADEGGVEETIARCSLVVYTIASGWCQKDLLMDFEDVFRMI